MWFVNQVWMVFDCTEILGCACCGRYSYRNITVCCWLMRSGRCSIALKYLVVVLCLVSIPKHYCVWLVNQVWMVFDCTEIFGYVCCGRCSYPNITVCGWSIRCGWCSIALKYLVIVLCLVSIPKHYCVWLVNQLQLFAVFDCTEIFGCACCGRCSKN